MSCNPKPESLRVRGRLQNKLRIVVGELRIMDRGCRVESEHLRAIAAEASRPIVITEARRRMHEEWLNYGEASEIKDAVIDGKESGGNRAIQAVFGVHRRTAANGDRAHGAFPCENSSIVPFAATVDAAAGGEDTIDPTFEYRGHAVPPQRKLENQDVAPKELLHLGLNVGRKPVARDRKPFFGML